uniref:Venom polypeptide n=1 Tax=Dolopus genitalis TaxID=2488630 RepID=A0A3G5BID6_DOLGE|nr:venom polypeptide [Dolopus genitalis]
MSRFFITLACIAFVGVCSAQNLDQHVQFVEDIEKFRAENPEVVLTPLTVESVTPYNQMRYTFGRRVLGDRIVTQGNNNFNYPQAQDVRTNLNYPANGIGNVVSYVEIFVDQTSNIGTAYVTSGGIGQRHISIVLEAKRTFRFSYRAAIYGY